MESSAITPSLLKEPAIYLASQSPRRRELLRQIGVLHEIINTDVNEVPRSNESPHDYVQRLACEKAAAGMAGVGRLGLAPRPVLGADTIVVCEGNILEKPRDAVDAAKMLRQMSGAMHQVMTAVAIATEERIMVKISVTEVVFRLLSESEISSYWHTGEPQDKAGGYAIQGFGAVFVDHIRGSYSGVVGLPIEQTVSLLRDFGVAWWQS